MTYSCKIFELPFDIYATKLGRKRKVVRHLPLGRRGHTRRKCTLFFMHGETESQQPPPPPLTAAAAAC